METFLASILSMAVVALVGSHIGMMLVIARHDAELKALQGKR